MRKSDKPSPIAVRKAVGSAMSSGGLFSSGGVLPSDVLQDSVRRLSFACLFYVFTFTMAYFASGLVHAIRIGSLAGVFVPPMSVVAFASISLALVLFLLCRLSRIRAELLLDLGLIFEVIGAFGISMSSIYGSFRVYNPELMETMGFTGIPWECVWIIIFPMFAPASPRKVLLASLGAASMGPLVMLFSIFTGATSPEMPVSVIAYYYLFSTYLCAILAFFSSFWIRKLGKQVKAARAIGQYELAEMLGKGGMGEVWRARHRLLAKPAAIKLIRPEALGGDEATRIALFRRFEREARATAALNSVHTISVYDFGLTPDGAFYYVMELLDGIDLETLVKKHGPQPAGRVIHLLRQACHSLGEAHATGLVHRDIKPANLFTCRLGPDRDFVKVLDFGLVKTDNTADPEASRLTQEGIAFGTPGYMAPEMAMGAGASDGRADLYALGCVGYWLLAGEPVFEGDTPLATVLHHVRTPPERPSLRTEVEIPEDLEALIMVCLAKVPDDRPQSAVEIEKHLAACAAAGDWTLSAADTWWDRHGPEPEAHPVTQPGSGDFVTRQV